MSEKESNDLCELCVLCDSCKFIHHKTEICPVYNKKEKLGVLYKREKQGCFMSSSKIESFIVGQLNKSGQSYINYYMIFYDYANHCRNYFPNKSAHNADKDNDFCNQIKKAFNNLVEQKQLKLFPLKGINSCMDIQTTEQMIASWFGKCIMPDWKNNDDKYHDVPLPVNIIGCINNILMCIKKVGKEMTLCCVEKIIVENIIMGLEYYFQSRQFTDIIKKDDVFKMITEVLIISLSSSFTNERNIILVDNLLKLFFKKLTALCIKKSTLSPLPSSSPSSSTDWEFSETGDFVQFQGKLFDTTSIEFVNAVVTDLNILFSVSI